MPTRHVNGLTMNYRWQGTESGPVLVLINGLLTDLTSWAGHLPAYTDAFRVLTYDCRGQGCTDKPDDGPYLPAQHAADLKGLLDALDVRAAALLGVSNGGCIALQFAARWPERVRALVLANAFGQADVAMQRKLASWLSAMELGGGPARFDVSSPWIWGATFLNRNFDALLPWREKGSTIPPHAAQHLIEGAMAQDVLAEVANISCPTLLMTGDEDVLTPRQYSHELQQRISGSKVVMLEPAGHAMFLEQTAQFVAVAVGFLRQHLL